MKAIINNVEYNLANYYNEQNYLVRLVIEGDYSFDDLKADILASDEILIKDNEGQNAASYAGYTRIRQIFAIMDENELPRIEITLEATNILSSIDNVQKKALDNAQDIVAALDEINTVKEDFKALSDTVTLLQSSIDNLSYEHSMFSQQISAEVALIKESLDSILASNGENAASYNDTEIIQ